MTSETSGILVWIAIIINMASAAFNFWTARKARRLLRKISELETLWEREVEKVRLLEKAPGRNGGCATHKAIYH